jgi:hypothetical protein
MEHDTKMNWDGWKSHCPICEKIVTEEDWPHKIQCGEIGSDEVKKGHKHPPCIVCGNEEILETFLTMPTKDMSSMVHSRLIHCESCGTGHYFDGMDAVTGKPRVIYKHPEELDVNLIREELQRHLDQGEENEDLVTKARFAIAAQAFFRPLQYYCLDEGWECLGYGVRPLERTEIMTRFYEWTNREAMDEAGQDDNPLRKSKRKRRR